MAFTESEDKKIETEIKKRSLESEVRKKEAEAREANARASRAETEALTAQLELHHKLNDAGMMLYRDERGNLTIFPKPNDQEPLQLE